MCSNVNCIKSSCLQYLLDLTATELVAEWLVIVSCFIYSYIHNTELFDSTIMKHLARKEIGYLSGGYQVEEMHLPVFFLCHCIY